MLALSLGSGMGHGQLAALKDDRAISHTCSIQVAGLRPAGREPAPSTPWKYLIRSMEFCPKLPALRTSSAQQSVCLSAVQDAQQVAWPVRFRNMCSAHVWGHVDKRSSSQTHLHRWCGPQT